MQLKLIPLLAGAIALSAATSLPLTAQIQPSQQQLAPVRDSKYKGIQLTEQQKAQMQSIREQTGSQIQAILTPEQRQQFQAAMGSGQKRRSAFADMNLSEQQKTQIREIMQSAKTQAEAVLTPAQRQQLQTIREQKRQQRQNRS
ncbi:hypothetical protein [Aliterella atlantica]|uniref:P pilus assembly/Cpx signaling pathway, periplasmic inhibitor/zinc-resistance associated protein n=1 Tax=Aliterella atlantica CENA595 TaxID=1618023 RepID=A0A0D8ZMX5_9CYAN|nr:hypothetical protein [Aliterella atlantica]KJH70120.1 hypothetical protein UH38_19835 [Aliterella atlantica CENA595]